MGTFVLVHGSWHGGWCWEGVSPLLEQGGHRAVALDLPGHGEDRTPIAEVSFGSYVDVVCNTLREQPEPVILVGHSMGGMVITQAAEYMPERVRTLVYLCAYLPQNGQSLADLNRHNRTSLLPQYTVQEQGLRTVRSEGVKEVFYHDCPDEDVERAKQRLVPEIGRSAVPVHVTQSRYGSIPRVYIHCLQDRSLSPDLQQQMYTDVPCSMVIPMETGHSPFYAAPEVLAGHLLALWEGRNESTP